MRVQGRISIVVQWKHTESAKKKRGRDLTFALDFSLGICSTLMLHILFNQQKATMFMEAQESQLLLTRYSQYNKILMLC